MTRKQKIFTLASLVIAGSVAQAATFEDLVYVDTTRMSQKSSALRPFYMDIFEMSGVDAVKLDTSISYNRDKPGRMTLAQAKLVCQKRNMRLPTKEEWLAAGSNLGQNRLYTLKGDTILSGSAYLVNINTGDSIKTNDTRIGIDAIGAMGMTGNRAEYFLNADGSSGECGGKYETRSATEVELSRTCNGPTDNQATVRCVVDASSSVVVQFTSKIPAALKTHLNSLGQSSGTPSNPANPANPGVDSNVPPLPPTPVTPAKPSEPEYDDQF